jgi:uncharacterized membrane protein YedE/YeeE
MEQPKPYWNPYIAGIALGLVLLATFYLMGNGLGASGAVARTAAVTAHAVFPEAVEKNGLFKEYYGAGKPYPLIDWMVFEVIGVFIGGIVAVFTAGRFKLESARGPRIGVTGRLFFALMGGLIAGIGTRLALGCTSGQALSGGATMAVGSWIFMMAVFGAAFGLAFLFRRQWL